MPNYGIIARLGNRLSRRSPWRHTQPVRPAAAMNDAKRAARHRAKAVREAAANPRDNGEAAFKLELVLKEFPDDSVIAGYLPIGLEISPVPVMERLAETGRSLCVPVVSGKRRPLRFRQWTPTADLVEAEHGIPVPSSGAWLRPDILIVPLLAFDARGYRLGYGGGHYDRTLEFLRGTGQPSAIGFAYEAQRTDRVPTEAFDQRLDMVVTESRVLRFGDTHPKR